MCCIYGKLNCTKWTCNSLVLSIIFTWVTSLDYYYGSPRFTNCPHCSDTCSHYIAACHTYEVLADIIACSQSLRLCLLDSAGKRVAANVVRSSYFYSPSHVIYIGIYLITAHRGTLIALHLDQLPRTFFWHFFAPVVEFFVSQNSFALRWLKVWVNIMGRLTHLSHLFVK